MTPRRKSGRRLSPRGSLQKGNQAELRVKRWVTAQEGVAFVLDGRPSEPGCDLLVFYRFPDRPLVLEVLEVKAGDWNRLSSAKRQSAAYAGDLWRARGVRHAVIDRASWPTSRLFTVGLINNRASTLLKPVEFSLDAPGGGSVLGLGTPQAPIPAPRAIEEE